MSKDVFRFKQFSVLQEGATLKICTDSCLFGAWVASSDNKIETVLDIGSGTGLLGLMYAQKHPESKVTAIEIDERSAALTGLNFEHSPWKSNLAHVHASLQDFARQGKVLFDCVICNPPFFENQLLSDKPGKNLSKHSAMLGREELMEGIANLITPEGIIYILLPPYEAEIFSLMAAHHGFSISERVKVLNRPGAAPIRHMLKLQKENRGFTEDEITIYESDKEYSDRFKGLLSDYYLYL